MANIGNMTMKINIEGLEKLDEVMSKHGDKLNLIGALDVTPESVIVFNYPGILSQEDQKIMFRKLNQVFPKNKTLILEDGMTLSIVNQEDLSEEEKGKVIDG